MTQELLSTTITFGKYKNSTIPQVLKDPSYCKWLLQQEWFQNNYEYLYNRVLEYNPLDFFLNSVEIPVNNFTQDYKFFNLIPLDLVEIELSNEEKKCYEYYLLLITELKNKIIARETTDNPYNIKAPSKWLKRFEKDYELNRSVFKAFLSSYDLPNIPYIVEDIKKEGGIEYKGAKSFLIAKKRSESQEAWWEIILKNKYGEQLSTQFKYEKCIFDFINISTNTIFECKLNIKDFNEQQYKKYLLTLEKYRIIYLIGYDCVINIKKKELYTLDRDKYLIYKNNIPIMKNPSKFDLLIEDFNIIQGDDLKTLFGSPSLTGCSDVPDILLNLGV
jgi:hypothetical protein